ncbi:Uncharacterized ACR, COG1678 [Budvicia aquatica]|uniref:Uncharacterized ACR, COG1678 n=1 Tax=Budvicia aquatica TaxID=82979 RepID=A0A485A0H3_9GAMM|nr:Uncharacterized ACR, COG1678 [Budvicia aquatica]
MPSLEDPYFSRSVVYICEHNENGTMGVVINKPLEQLTVEEVLSKLHIDPIPKVSRLHLECPVFDGGPLAEDRGFILHTPAAKILIQHSDC